MCSCFVCVCIAFVRPSFVCFHLLCVHWRRRLCSIWVCVIAWCSPRRCTLSGYLGVGFVWSHVDLDPLLRRFFTMSPASWASSGSFSECRWQLLYQGNKLASGYGKRPSFKQRVLMITHGANYQLP